jgi:hypothetical protein
MTFLLVSERDTRLSPVSNWRKRIRLFFETEGGGCVILFATERPLSSQKEWKPTPRITSSTRSSLLLQEHDYYAIDVTKISKKAGVSRATFYRIFQSKEDIIKAYFERSELEFLEHPFADEPL